MRLIFLLCFLFSSVLLHAQLKQVSIRDQNSSSKKKTTARTEGTQSLSPMQLPFWDDFSFNKSAKNYPNDSLWQYGHSVWVNTGMGINPPTLNVATFDGVDSLGTPYSVNTPLSKGVADRLVSRPLRMDLVDPTQKNSVFIFFYYQFQGNGEPPDLGDELSLWFKNDSSIWKQVWSVQYDTTMDKTKFVPVKLFVNDTCNRCFHKNFQFKFQNHARLSGPFDTWNLDYVYVSNGKPQSSPPHEDFPDRAIATPLDQLVNQYQSVPVKHLLSKGDALLKHPQLTITNQRKDQNINTFPQTTNYIVRLTSTTRSNNAITTTRTRLDSLAGPNVFYNQPETISLQTLPTFTSFDPKTDSIALNFKFEFNSGDNKVKSTDPSNKGDYDPIVYEGIDFRHNDTTSTNFIFSSYYAYDDGIAEYAATLTQPGNYLAYQFDMMYDQSDTLVAVDVYFPHVGDESNQVIHLMIFRKLETGTRVTKASVYTQQDLTVARTENNRFIRVNLDTAQVVSGTFYVGYKQNSNASIGVGLDKRYDSGDKIFVNLGSGWQPSNLEGNLMIRAVFGNSEKVKGPITALEEKKIFVHPNPNHGVFYLPQFAQHVQVIDVAGRQISFEQEDSYDSIQVTLRSQGTGIYLVRYFNGTKWQTEKIIVLP